MNVALFGFTAKAWRDENPELEKKNNVRDFASINELTVLSNLETHNAQMIREGRNKTERFQILWCLIIIQLGEGYMKYSAKTKPGMGDPYQNTIDKCIFLRYDLFTIL